MKISLSLLMNQQRIKALASVVLVSAALMPWNATAIHQDALAQPLFVRSQQANSIERLLVQALQSIKQGQLQQALDVIQQLLVISPNFKLAHLIHGDLLTAKARTLHRFGDVGEAENAKILDLKAEAEIRIRNYFDRDRGATVPKLMVDLAPSQQHVLFVDTAKSRLYVFAKSPNDQLNYVADYYVTIGKNGIGKKDQGDKRTPIGVYFASKKLNRPLPDLYGDAAYPLNYPNEIDSFEHKSGFGIWIHGTPSDTYSRPPRDSDGCVVLSNPDMKALQAILQPGNTPVVIGVNFEWVNPQALKGLAPTKQALKAALEAWRQDWTAQNTEAYLSHYADAFFYADGRLTQWANYKRQIQATKPKVTVNLNDVSMFTYPGTHQPMVVVEFEQTYHTATLHSVMKKRQYWVQEQQQWKILYEGSA